MFMQIRNKQIKKYIIKIYILHLYIHVRVFYVTICAPTKKALALP